MAAELWVIDAVRLTTRVFRRPTPMGYGDTWDAATSRRLVPAFAPDPFALLIADLEIEG